MRRADEAAEAERAREERRREADRNEIFNDVYKSIEEIRAEWQAAVRTLRLWAIAFVVTLLGGLVIPVIWVLGLIVGTGLMMAWGTAAERKSAYKRAVYESELERKILAHEARTSDALLQREPTREGG